MPQSREGRRAVREGMQPGPGDLINRIQAAEITECEYLVPDRAGQIIGSFEGVVGGIPPFVSQSIPDGLEERGG